MRSLMEVRFARGLDRRGIRWEYEPERLRGGRYLVDFYLPDLRCWVEVKGRFEARDDLLLPMVARNLRQQRDEGLFLFMHRRAFRVTGIGFEPLTHDAFWEALRARETEPPAGADAAGTPSAPDEQAPPAAATKRPPPDPRLDRLDRDRKARRPWERNE
jgi:hypothetical protein